MFSIKNPKQYYFILYPSSGFIHPLGAFLLFTISLVLSSSLIILISPIFHTNDEQQHETILKIRADAIQFIEKIQSNQINLTEEFDWIDHFPKAIRYLNIQLKNVEYIHTIRYIFVVYNTILIEILFSRKISHIVLIIPMTLAIVGSCFDIIENTKIFIIFSIFFNSLSLGLYLLFLSVTVKILNFDRLPLQIIM